MFTVVLDACVLVPPTLADAILRIAERGVFGVRWSSTTLDEIHRTMVRKGATASQADRRIAAMTTAFPFATVEDDHNFESAVTNHPKDRHVLAAAIRAGCHTVVTSNLKDFPEPSLSPWGVEVLHPDPFLMNQLDLSPGEVLAALARQSADYRRPPLTIEEILGRMSRSGVPDFADECRRHLQQEAHDD